MKLTRRQLVIAAAGSAVAANTSAQSPTPNPPAATDFEKQARDAVQRNADAVAKLVVPMSTEPAFQFKA